MSAAPALPENFVTLYRELVQRLPHLSTHNYLCDNSDYSDQLNESRNAYLCFNGYGLEDCFCNFDSRWNKSCIDFSFSNKCELCYDCIDTEKCYNCDFLQDCERCTDCQYCYDCFACTSCFGCVGLRQAKFQIFNQPYSKNEYPKKLAATQKLSESEIRARMEKLRLAHPHVAMHLRGSENCFGDYIFDSKNCYYTFKGHELEDCNYIYNSRGLKDCIDIGMLHKSELIYEAIEATENYNCNFIYWCANCTNCEYIMYCFNCENCFGCFNLKRKKFHILNQPYPEKEYFALVKKIKTALKKQNQYHNFLPDIVR